MPKSRLPNKEHDIIENDTDSLTKKLQQRQVSKKEFFMGPLPPPDILKHYKDINPELLTDIVAMAKKEQNHRHKYAEEVISLKNKELKASEVVTRRKAFLDDLLKPVLAFILVVLLICGAFASAYLKFHYTVTLAFLAPPVMAVLINVYSKQGKLKNNKQED